MADAYALRVNAVMDYVRRNLDHDLSLAELARVAHFSPYHFHRIFKGVTGETVAQFTRRARLERAVELMRGAPDRDLGSIGVEVGFATPSEFSRIFRTAYGRPPSVWDRRSRLDGAADLTADAGRSAVADLGLTAQVVNRPACRLAYVRVRRPWQGRHLAEGYERLSAWLADRGVDGFRQELVGLSWESGKVTPLDRVVYDLGVTVPAEVEAEGEIGIHLLPAAPAVEVHCRELWVTAYAWEYLYRDWLPGSRFGPADQPAVKRFRVVPRRLDADAWDVDCSIALRPRP